jgi:transcriptional regulator with GAF, ATPase, and Fis domain
MAKNRDISMEESTLGMGGVRPSDSLCLRVVQDSIVMTHVLPKSGSLVIGRGATSDVVVDHPSISRRHAVLHIGERLEIEDLGSANGTKVRGDSVGVGVVTEVRPGEIIEVGAVILAVHRPDAGPVPPSSRHPAEPPRSSMETVHRLVERVSAGTISVLILGETGVGKEILAERVHTLSPRAKNPLVKLNCAAFSETLLASELFGHEKGAFSGADETKTGLLEVANGGTVFLDELGELSLSIQSKLLRVLEERAVLRVGALKPRPIDVRFVAATNRDLETEVARGTFRQDLYFRLNAFTVRIPPLRERRDEIRKLAHTFACEVARKLGRTTEPVLTQAAIGLLEKYAWPGNVRELRNVMERAVLLAPSDAIDPDCLPLEKMAAPTKIESTGGRSRDEGPLDANSDAPVSELPESLRERLLMAERERIVSTLAACAGNQTKAAKLLGISRGTLVARLETFGVPRPRKK